MKKKGIIALSILLLLVITYFIYAANPHKYISVDKIESAAAWSQDGTYKNIDLSSDQINQLVELFNSAKISGKNLDFAGITPSFGITVKFKKGISMTINEAESSYGNIEVQRNILFKNVSYYLNDKAFFEFIKTLAAK